MMDMEHVIYGSRQRVEEFISSYNWLCEQIVDFVIKCFHKF